MTGASSVEEIERYFNNSGFSNINIQIFEVSEEYAAKWSHDLQVGEYIMSASIEAVK